AARSKVGALHEDAVPFRRPHSTPRDHVDHALSSPAGSTGASPGREPSLPCANRNEPRAGQALGLQRYRDRLPGEHVASPQIGRRSWRSTPASVSAASDESVTPSSRMPLPTGKSGPRSSDTMASIAARDASGASTVRLRVTCRKSAYLALSVTVRPRMADPSQ